MKATRDRHAKKRAEARPEPQPDRIDASILVVDDEAMLRKVVGRGLTAAGCTVTYAADGEEALAKLAEAPPDLVISDVTMPRVDGFELLKRIREQTTTKALPVILLTGRGDTEDIVAGMGLGADDYLVKPFELRELLARVRAKIERPPGPAARSSSSPPSWAVSTSGSSRMPESSKSAAPSPSSMRSCSWIFDRCSTRTRCAQWPAHRGRPRGLACCACWSASPPRS